MLCVVSMMMQDCHHFTAFRRAEYNFGLSFPRHVASNHVFELCLPVMYNCYGTADIRCVVEEIEFEMKDSEPSDTLEASG